MAMSKGGRPHFLRTFYRQIRLFTLGKLVKKCLFSSQMWTFYLWISICGPKRRNISTANNERNLHYNLLKQWILAILCNTWSLFLMFSKAKLLLCVFKAACILGDCNELIRTDRFIRLNKLGWKQTERHLWALIYLTTLLTKYSFEHCCQVLFTYSCYAWNRVRLGLLKL